MDNNNNDNMQDLIGKLNNFAKDNNITQDNINNLFNMLNNNNSKEEKYNNKNTYTKSNSNQNNFNKNSSSYNNINNIDLETIMKMKTIIDKMNSKDDPRSNLLRSLKPYLNESKKNKIDQYISLMNMSKVIDVFPFMNGGGNYDK